MTLCIDAYSRLLTGWSLSLVPNAATVLTALRMGMLIDPARGEFGGLPRTLRPDRGMEFVAKTGRRGRDGHQGPGRDSPAWRGRSSRSRVVDRISRADSGSESRADARRRGRRSWHRAGDDAAVAGLDGRGLAHLWQPRSWWPVSPPACSARTSAAGRCGSDCWHFWPRRLPMALTMLAFAGLLGLANGLSGAPSGGGPLRGGPPTQAALAAIPSEQLALMQQVAADSSCHLPWTVLAAIADTESGFGANMATSSAGAIGYGQFLPSTWALPGIGNGGNPYDYQDALPAMARYLCQAGAGQDLRGAIWAYNHADWYVAEVLQKADRYGGLGASGGGLVAGWSNAPALNQYDERNYVSAAMWQQWDAAACSAHAHLEATAGPSVETAIR